MFKARRRIVRVGWDWGMEEEQKIGRLLCKNRIRAPLLFREDRPEVQERICGVRDPVNNELPFLGSSSNRILVDVRT